MAGYYGEAAPTNGDEAYGSEPETTETSTEEFLTNERLDTSWYIYKYYAWGIVHVAMIIIGAYIQLNGTIGSLLATLGLLPNAH